MRARLVGYALTTAIAVLVFAGSGIANLVRAEHVANDMSALGYPAYFMTLLGVWKLLGAVVIALPRLARAKEWAYAGMIFDLTGAATSRAASGDAVETVMVPLAIAAVVVGSWALRPHGRRLEASSGAATKAADR
jgi:hypothetical protein